jgi:hypothetical protein
MKKMLLFAGLLFSMSATAQVLYYEDFDGIPGPTAGGAGTYSFPSNMLKRNVDNLAPAASVSYVNEAWERREDFVTNVTDSCAFSTSWYTPAGTANDWMWTPLIGPLGANSQLSWEAMAPDISYADGYEVRLMPAAVGPPTGGAGVIGNQITSSVLVFSTAGENSTWTTRTVDLSAYAGQSGYIGFRNNSNDKFLLMIDNILVENLGAADAAVYQDETFEYTLTPINQAYAIGTSGVVTNEGAGVITNVNITLNVYDGAMSQVYTETSTPVASLAAGASSTFSLTGYTPSVPDVYTVELVATLAEADVDMNNNTIQYPVVFTDSVFARDNGNVTGTLGIGAGNGGQLGQAFTLTTADEITSVSIFIGNGAGNMVGQPLSGGVWATDVTGTPTTLLASTVTITMGSEVDSLWTLPIVGGSYSLAAGEYVVVVNEVDSNVTVGTVNSIFTPGKTWVNWPTNPLGNWAHNEDFSFNVSYVIRANFAGGCLTTSSTLTETACDSYLWAENGQTYTTSGIYTVTLTNACGGDSLVMLDLTIETLDLGVTVSDPTATANLSGGTYQWIECTSGTAIPGATGQTFTAPLTGQYAVIVTGNCGTDTSACVTINVSGLSELSLDGMVEVYPNPANGEFFVHVNGLLNENLSVEVVDLNGKVVAREERQNVQGEVHVAMKLNVEPGVYMVNISTDQRSMSERLVITRK